MMSMFNWSAKKAATKAEETKTVAPKKLIPKLGGRFDDAEIELALSDVEPRTQKVTKPARKKTPCSPVACGIKAIFLGSPFGVFVAASICLNLPPFIVGLTDVARLSSLCHASMWLIGNCVFCLVHMAAAIYISLSVLETAKTKGDVQDIEQTASSNPAMTPRKRLFQKARFLLCHDPSVTFYFGFLAFYFCFSLAPLLLVQFGDNAKAIVNKYSNNDDTAYNYYANNNNNGNNYNYANNNNGNGDNNYNYANDNPEQSSQEDRCSTFSSEKVVICMGFALAWVVLGLASLFLGYCLAYSDDLEEGNADDDGEDGATYVEFQDIEDQQPLQPLHDHSTKGEEKTPVPDRNVESKAVATTTQDEEAAAATVKDAKEDTNISTTATGSAKQDPTEDIKTDSETSILSTLYSLMPSS